MPDLSAGFDIPNPYGLLAADFAYDIDGYRAALGFLGDLASGSPEREALETNGGNHPMLVAWQRSQKFQRVLAKCRNAGRAEQSAREAASEASAATEAEDQGNPPGQRFIPLSEAPVTHSAFRGQPTVGTWGPGA